MDSSKGLLISQNPSTLCRSWLRDAVIMPEQTLPYLLQNRLIYSNRALTYFNNELQVPQSYHNRVNSVIIIVYLQQEPELIQLTSKINGLESRLKFSRCDREVTISVCYKQSVYAMHLINSAEKNIHMVPDRLYNLKMKHLQI